jgi:hypothetical protein
MPRTGRPSKLTPEARDRLCRAIRAGCSLKDAALCAGIDRATLQRWLARGRAEQAGEYCDLCGAVTRARAECEVRCLALINRAARKDWRAAAWLLERRYPQRFGRPEARPARRAAPPPMPVGVAIDLQPYMEILRSIDAPPQGAPPGAPPAPSLGLPQPSAQPSGTPGPRAAGGE